MLSWLPCIIDGRVYLPSSISLSDSWILLNLPTFSCSSATSRAVHQSGHTSHRVACNHLPPLGIPLHTSHSQKPGWSHAWTGALSVSLHWFSRLLEAQHKQRTPPFSWVVTMLPAPAYCNMCLFVAVSWADCFSLLKSPSLPGAGSTLCCLF